MIGFIPNSLNKKGKIDKEKERSKERKKKQQITKQN
jgi:hypothetical protein